MTLLALLLGAQTVVFGALFVLGLRRIDGMATRIAFLEAAMHALLQTSQREERAVAPVAMPAMEPAEALSAVVWSERATVQRPPSITEEYHEPDEDSLPLFPFLDLSRGSREAPLRRGEAHRSEPRRTETRLTPPSSGRERSAARKTRTSRTAKASTPSSRKSSPQAWPWRDADKRRALGAAGVFAAPALWATFAPPEPALILVVLALTLAAMALSMRAIWRPVAWVGAIGGGAWALAGVLAGTAAGYPLLYGIALTVAGVGGLAHARVDKSWEPGVVLALGVAGASLLGGHMVSMAGPIGASFAMLALCAAAIGASAHRLEGVHLAGFAAAGLGLYLLSGQSGGAVWFTPAAAIAGAAFGAIGAVRAPHSGEHGGTLAVTGVIGPAFAVACLALAGHGLETPLAVSAAFFGLGLVFVALLGASQRQKRRPASLPLTGWAFGVGAMGCLGASVLICVSPAFAPLEPTIFALAGLGLMTLERRQAWLMWRLGAVAALCATFVTGFDATRQIGITPSPLPGSASLLFAIAIPTGLAWLTAREALKRAPWTGAAFDVAAVFGTAAMGSAIIRFVFSSDALWVSPIGFVEAGVHAAWFVLFSTVTALSAARGALQARRMSALALASSGVALTLVAMILIPTGFWRQRPLMPDALAELYSGQLSSLTAIVGPVGVMAPMLAAALTWFVYRRAGAPAWRVHVARAVAALFGALWLTLQATLAWQEPSWAPGAAATFAILAAIGVAIIPMRPLWLTQQRAPAQA